MLNVNVSEHDGFPVDGNPRAADGNSRVASSTNKRAVMTAVIFKYFLRKKCLLGNKFEEILISVWKTLMKIEKTIRK